MSPPTKSADAPAKPAKAGRKPWPARRRVAFLIRLSAAAPLYTPERLARSRFREGVLYYWPQWAQRHQQQPLRVRVLRLRSRGSEVWLMTSVLDPARLTRSTASTFYR